MRSAVGIRIRGVFGRTRRASAGHPGELYYNVRSKSMGKRELLLIVAFVIVGAIVYQFTAPPPAPGERSFSHRSAARTHPPRRCAEIGHPPKSTTTRALIPSTRAVTEAPGELAHRRADDHRRGPDRHRGGAPRPLQRVRRRGGAAAGQGDGAAGRSGRQRASSPVIFYPRQGTQRALRLTLKVPARLQVTLEASGGPDRRVGVAGVELSSTRGEARVRNDRRQGHGHSSRRRTARRRLRSGQADHDGHRRADRTHPRRNVDEHAIRRAERQRSRRARSISIRTARTSRSTSSRRPTGILRINAVGGSVDVKGLQTEARIDVRGADVDVVASIAPRRSRSTAKVAIRSRSRRRRGGYQLDAVASDGDITLPEGTLETHDQRRGAPRDRRRPRRRPGSRSAVRVRTSRDPRTLIRIDRPLRHPSASRVVRIGI